MSKPLQPLGRGIHVAVVCPAGGLHGSAEAEGVQGVAGLPEGVALEVKSCNIRLASEFIVEWYPMSNACGGVRSSRHGEGTGMRM